MSYKILKQETTIPVIYWTFVLDSNGVIFETEDLAVLEAKLKEISVTVPCSKLKIVSEIGFDADFIIDPIETPVE